LPDAINEVELLPTPRERDYKNAAATEQTALDRIDRGYGLDIAEAIQLLPTPRAMSGGGDNSAGQDRPSGHKGTTNLHGLLQDPKTNWGKYAPAIERWAGVIDRPAPEPTDDKGRLNPALVEWMMGYPEGWTEGVSRTGQLKALGNAIVPHQAAAAWGNLLGMQAVTKPDEVKLLPTPAAWDGDRGPDYARTGRDGSGGDDLVTTVAKMAGGRE